METNKLQLVLEQIAAEIESVIEFDNDQEKQFFLESVLTIIVDSEPEYLEENIQDFLQDNYQEPQLLQEGIMDTLGRIAGGIGWAVKGTLKHTGKFIKNVGKGIGAAMPKFGSHYGDVNIKKYGSDDKDGKDGKDGKDKDTSGSTLPVKPKKTGEGEGTGGGTAGMGGGGQTFNINVGGATATTGPVTTTQDQRQAASSSAESRAGAESTGGAGGSAGADASKQDMTTSSKSKSTPSPVARNAAKKVASDATKARLGRADARKGRVRRGNEVVQLKGAALKKQQQEYKARRAGKVGKTPARAPRAPSISTTSTSTTSPTMSRSGGQNVTGGTSGNSSNKSGGAASQALSGGGGHTHSHNLGDIDNSVRVNVSGGKAGKAGASGKSGSTGASGKQSKSGSRSSGSSASAGTGKAGGDIIDAEVVPNDKKQNKPITGNTGKTPPRKITSGAKEIVRAHIEHDESATSLQEMYAKFLSRKLPY